MLAVVIGRAAPLRVENNVVVIWVPLHVMLLRGLRDGCHRQRRRHLHACLLVSDPEYSEHLLHRLLLALRLDKLPRFFSPLLLLRTTGRTQMRKRGASRIKKRSSLSAFGKIYAVEHI